jgi:hypothetical protein
VYLVFVQEGSVGHTQLLTLLHVHFYLCVRACMRVYVRASMCVYVCACMCVYVRACMRVYACKCVCAYVAACTHMDKRSTEL